MSEPEHDPQFARLLADWREELGPEKNEGIGLLWKEGGIEALFDVLRLETPRTANALAGALAAAAPDDHAFLGTAFTRFLAAMTAPTRREREARLSEHELAVPIRWRDALAMLEPPMPKRFRERIEAWLDRARGIERRCDGAVEAPAIQVGSAVYHPAFGEGVVSAVQDTTATVTFSVGEKKLKIDRLELRAHPPE